MPPPLEESMNQKLLCAFLMLLLAGPALAGDVERSPFMLIGRWYAEVRRGEQLVAIGGCNDCHTPLKISPEGPVPDTSRLLSGHPEELEVPTTAFEGPCGTAFAANLTPDRETGLGDWTDQDFVKTMRTGRHPGTGRALAKHWPAVTKRTDAELRAIYLYLRSIPAIRNQVPPPVSSATSEASPRGASGPKADRQP
jgi:hypothetical protein